MSIIAKNTTQSDITIAGQVISANSQYSVQDLERALWSTSDLLITKIASGDIVINDGLNDLSQSEAVRHLQGSYPKNLDIEKITPFASKKIVINGVLKSIFKRIHGVNATIGAGQTENIDLVIPYVWVKFTGAEIFNTEIGDVLDFTVHDDDDNTISGLDPQVYGANLQLNKFGYTVQMPNERYKNTSDYDADLYQGMIIRCRYTNNSQSSKTVSMNVWLHEIKD